MVNLSHKNKMAERQNGRPGSGNAGIREGGTAGLDWSGKGAFVREGEEGVMTEQCAGYRAELLHESSYRTTEWSGGLTTELAIAPEGSAYADRDFLWRLSSATVDAEESRFTALPDYDRIILTLKGKIRLSHNGREWMELSEYEPHSFDGADETRSVGKVRDFNLMMRKGRCRGRVEVIRLEENGGDRQILWAEPGADTVFFYCAEGRALIRAADGQGLWKEGLLERQKKEAIGGPEREKSPEQEKSPEGEDRTGAKDSQDGARAAETAQFKLKAGDSLKLEKTEEKSGDAGGEESLPGGRPLSAAFSGTGLALEGTGILIAASVWLTQDREDRDVSLEGGDSEGHDRWKDGGDFRQK